MFPTLSGLIPTGIKNSMRFTQLSRCKNSAAELNRLHYISEDSLMGFYGGLPKNIASPLRVSGSQHSLWLLILYLNLSIR